METTIARCLGNPPCPQTALHCYSHAHGSRYSSNRGVPTYFSSRFVRSLDANRLCCANSASNRLRLRAVLTQQDGVVSAAALPTTEKAKESEPPFRLEETGVDGAATSPKGGIESTVSITVVGASGDLAKKKIFPALFALYYEDCLPKHFTIYGYARSKMTDAELRKMISGKLTCRIDKRANCEDKMDQFLQRCFYHAGQYNSENNFKELDKKMKEHELGLFLNTIKRILDVLHPKVETQLRSWASFLIIPVTGDRKVVFGEQMNGITVMLRTKYKSFLQAIVEKLSDNTHVQRTTKLKRILQETKEAGGENEIRERMQPLNAQLMDTICHLHDIFTCMINFPGSWV